MKLSILLTSLLFFAITANAQNPNCQWAKGFGNGALSGGQSMATDANGNVYVTGSFIDTTLIFGADTLINNSGGIYKNMFLVKYDSSGNTVWARSANGGATANNFDNSGVAVGTDAAGNVYVIGAFEDSVLYFGSVTLLSTNIYTFLVKYNAQGDALWALNIGGTLNEADGLAVDANGNCYISGYFTSGSIIGGTDTIPAAGYIEGYVIKYDSSGNSLWAAGISGGNVLNYSVAIDAATNVYVAGGYSGDSVFIGHITLTNSSAAGIYTVKYDAGGQAVWAQNVTVSGNIYPTGICTDAQSNVYITGNTTADTLVFGSDTAFTATSSATSNIFIAKYNASGNAQWVRCTQNNNNIYSSGISATAAGDVFVTGTFENTAVQIGNTTLTDNDTINETEALFVAEYNNAGNAIWVTGGLTAKNDIDGGVSIIADNNGHLYLSGIYEGQGINLDNNTLPFIGAVGSATATESNLFAARYSLAGTSTGIAIDNNANNLTVYPNPSAGNFYFKGINTGSTLQVYDVTGRRIYTTLVTGNNYTLNISTQAKGIYFYRVVDVDGTVQDGKILVE